jgi:gamma-glutamyltranspeptidase / glutathione hydrolase
MTDRWLNVVLSIAVVVGLAVVAVYEQPRRAEERAELLGQEVAEVDDVDPVPAERRDPVAGLSDVADEMDPAAPAARDEYGVTASHPLAVEVGMGVLAAGGNAVDAAIAVSYALGVAEPFGSGIGGGGAMIVHELDEEPIGYDYRETAPQSGELPSSDIGVPGFVAGMEQIHERHGSMDLAELIEPAVLLAEDGIEVNEYLNARLRAAAHRLPIHEIPRFFPDGAAIAEGETLVQPEYAEALRLIQEQGSEVMYGGELGQRIADAVSGLDIADFEAYEVLEVDPAVGSFAGVDVISGGPPVSGPTLVQFLQVAEALGVTEMDPESAEHHHATAQAYRLAIADRVEYITDPSVEDVPIAGLLDPDYARRLAELVPDDGFVPREEADEAVVSPETDTTQFVVVDTEGTMVSATNTLSNFFGSGLNIDGFFLNDQLKNFSRDPESVNAPAAGKRPRSYITPTIVAHEGQPLLGLGSPGGRRIPMIVGQVLIRWAGHRQGLEAAAEAPRTHLEGHELFVEEDLPGDVAETLAGYGYQITAEAPVTEFYGGIQALRVRHDEGTIEGYADERRAGEWASASG